MPRRGNPHHSPTTVAPRQRPVQLSNRAGKTTDQRRRLQGQERSNRAMFEPAHGRSMPDYDQAYQYRQHGQPAAPRRCLAFPHTSPTQAHLRFFFIFNFFNTRPLRESPPGGGGVLQSQRVSGA
jgi:hypothetical protein